MLPAASLPAVRRRVTARDRAERRLRILAHLQAGWSYEAIAAEERLSRERIRQIVVESLAERIVDARHDHLRLQIARLSPALRLAAAQVAAGDLRAVDRLIKVLDRLDKYQGAAAALHTEDTRAYDELMAKLADMTARRKAAEAAGPEREAAPPPGDGAAPQPPALPPGGETENPISRFFPPQVVENARFGQK